MSLVIPLYVIVEDFFHSQNWLLIMISIFVVICEMTSMSKCLLLSCCFFLYDYYYCLIIIFICFVFFSLEIILCLNDDGVTTHSRYADDVGAINKLFRIPLASAVYYDIRYFFSFVKSYTPGLSVSDHSWFPFLLAYHYSRGRKSSMEGRNSYSLTANVFYQRIHVYFAMTPLDETTALYGLFIVTCYGIFNGYKALGSFCSLSMMLVRGQYVATPTVLSYLVLKYCLSYYFPIFSVVLTSTRESIVAVFVFFSSFEISCFINYSLARTRGRDDSHSPVAMSGVTVGFVKMLFDICCVVGFIALLFEYQMSIQIIMSEISKAQFSLYKRDPDGFLRFHFEWFFLAFGGWTIGNVYGTLLAPHSKKHISSPVFTSWQGIFFFCFVLLTYAINSDHREVQSFTFITFSRIVLPFVFFVFFVISFSNYKINFSYLFKDLIPTLNDEISVFVNSIRTFNVRIHSNTHQLFVHRRKGEDTEETAVPVGYQLLEDVRLQFDVEEKDTGFFSKTANSTNYKTVVHDEFGVPDSVRFFIKTFCPDDDLGPAKCCPYANNGNVPDVDPVSVSLVSVFSLFSKENHAPFVLPSVVPGVYLEDGCLPVPEGFLLFADRDFLNCRYSPNIFSPTLQGMVAIKSSTYSAIVREIYSCRRHYSSASNYHDFSKLDYRGPLNMRFDNLLPNFVGTSNLCNPSNVNTIFDCLGCESWRVHVLNSKFFDKLITEDVYVDGLETIWKNFAFAHHDNVIVPGHRFSDKYSEFVAPGNPDLALVPRLFLPFVCDFTASPTGAPWDFTADDAALPPPQFDYCVMADSCLQKSYCLGPRHHSDIYVRVSGVQHNTSFDVCKDSLNLILDERSVPISIAFGTPQFVKSPSPFVSGVKGTLVPETLILPSSFSVLVSRHQPHSALSQEAFINTGSPSERLLKFWTIVPGNSVNKMVKIFVTYFTSNQSPWENFLFCSICTCFSYVFDMNAAVAFEFSSYVSQNLWPLAREFSRTNLRYSGFYIRAMFFFSTTLYICLLIDWISRGFVIREGKFFKFLVFLGMLVPISASLTLLMTLLSYMLYAALFFFVIANLIFSIGSLVTKLIVFAKSALGTLCFVRNNDKSLLDTLSNIVAKNSNHATLCNCCKPVIRRDTDSIAKVSIANSSAVICHLKHCTKVQSSVADFYHVTSNGVVTNTETDYCLELDPESTATDLGIRLTKTQTSMSYFYVGPPTFCFFIVCFFLFGGHSENNAVFAVSTSISLSLVFCAAALVYFQRRLCGLQIPFSSNPSGGDPSSELGHMFGCNGSAFGINCNVPDKPDDDIWSTISGVLFIISSLHLIVFQFTSVSIEADIPSFIAALSPAVSAFSSFGRHYDSVYELLHFFVRKSEFTELFEKFCNTCTIYAKDSSPDNATAHFALCEEVAEFILKCRDSVFFMKSCGVSKLLKKTAMAPGKLQSTSKLDRNYDTEDDIVAITKAHSMRPGFGVGVNNLVRFVLPPNEHQAVHANVESLPGIPGKQTNVTAGKRPEGKCFTHNMESLVETFTKKAGLKVPPEDLGFRNFEDVESIAQALFTMSLRSPAALGCHCPTVPEMFASATDSTNYNLQGSTSSGGDGKVGDQLGSYKTYARICKFLRSIILFGELPIYVIDTMLKREVVTKKPTVNPKLSFENPKGEMHPFQTTPARLIAVYDFVVQFIMMLLFNVIEFGKKTIGCKRITSRSDVCNPNDPTNTFCSFATDVRNSHKGHVSFSGDDVGGFDSHVTAEFFTSAFFVCFMVEKPSAVYSTVVAICLQLSVHKLFRVGYLLVTFSEMIGSGCFLTSVVGTSVRTFLSFVWRYHCAKPNAEYVMNSFLKDRNLGRFGDSSTSLKVQLAMFYNSNISDPGNRVNVRDQKGLIPLPLDAFSKGDDLVCCSSTLPVYLYDPSSVSRRGASKTIAFYLNFPERDAPWFYVTDRFNSHNTILYCSNVFSLEEYGIHAGQFVPKPPILPIIMKFFFMLENKEGIVEGNGDYYGHLKKLKMTDAVLKAFYTKLCMIILSKSPLSKTLNSLRKSIERVMKERFIPVDLNSINLFYLNGNPDNAVDIPHNKTVEQLLDDSGFGDFGSYNDENPDFPIKAAIEAFHSDLPSSPPSSITQISGPPGCGKTSLALSYLGRHKKIVFVSHNNAADREVFSRISEMHPHFRLLHRLAVRMEYIPGAASDVFSGTFNVNSPTDTSTFQNYDVIGLTFGTFLAHGKCEHLKAFLKDAVLVIDEFHLFLSLGIPDCYYDAREKILITSEKADTVLGALRIELVFTPATIGNRIDLSYDHDHLAENCAAYLKPITGPNCVIRAVRWKNLRPIAKVMNARGFLVLIILRGTIYEFKGTNVGGRDKLSELSIKVIKFDDLGCNVCVIMDNSASTGINIIPSEFSETDFVYFRGGVVFEHYTPVADEKGPYYGFFVENLSKKKGFFKKTPGLSKWEVKVNSSDDELFQTAARIRGRVNAIIYNDPSLKSSDYVPVNLFPYVDLGLSLYRDNIEKCLMRLRGTPPNLLCLFILTSIFYCEETGRSCDGDRPPIFMFMLNALVTYGKNEASLTELSRKCKDGDSFIKMVLLNYSQKCNYSILPLKFLYDCFNIPLLEKCFTLACRRFMLTDRYCVVSNPNSYRPIETISPFGIKFPTRGVKFCSLRFPIAKGSTVYSDERLAVAKIFQLFSGKNQ